MKTWKFLIAALVCVSLPAVSFADEKAADPSDKYLSIWGLVTDIPDTAWSGIKTAFSKDALPAWGVVVGSSAVLYHYDEDILNNVQAQGRTWGLGNQVHYKSLINAGNLTLWSGPTDTAGWLYFMGDGTIPIVASIAMMGTGYGTSNSHLYNAGVEMGNGLLTAAIFDQLIKRSVGRQSPSKATENRGKWQPFPNLKAYSADTSKYDAMPSGHIMSATVMFTVIEQEFSEYNYIVYPAEVAWLGVLGWGMINVGVHWASDYPAGIALGYLFGRAAVQIHHPKKGQKVSQVKYFPSVDMATGTPTMNALYTF